MADRWSNPSGSLGVHRFMVWPAGADSYSHTDLTNNWDSLDAIIGQPSNGSQWPPTTGLDGGIYAEVQKHALGRSPIGSVWYWFRPSVAVPLTTYSSWGWVIADGSTLGPGQHEFPGIGGSVVLPNLLNSFILGADVNLALGAAGVAETSGNINVPAGAPGIGGTGGFNGVAITVSQMPSHNHGGGDHTHTFNRQVLQLVPNAGLNYLVNVRDAITHTETTNSSGTIINSQGSGQNTDNRPSYVGLLPIIKVKNVSSV